MNGNSVITVNSVTGNICIVVKGRRTVTGVCGPYNLGGSATFLEVCKLDQAWLHFVSISHLCHPSN